MYCTCTTDGNHAGIKFLNLQFKNKQIHEISLKNYNLIGKQQRVSFLFA